MYVTSFSVFHTEATVSIGLKNVLRMVTSILQNYMSMLRSKARQISLSFLPDKDNFDKQWDSKTAQVQF